MRPLNLTISTDSTFEDIKQRIKEEEDYDLGGRQLLVGFYPVEPTMKIKADLYDKGQKYLENSRYGLFLISCILFKTSKDM